MTEPSPNEAKPNNFREWYLRIVAALAPFIVAMETYQLTNQYKANGFSGINILDFILLVAWGYIFVKFTIPYAERLLKRKSK